MGFELIDEVLVSNSVGYMKVSIDEDARAIMVEIEDEDPKIIDY